ncbi:putative progesterone-induced-blocking factor [Schistosoma mansoni]|uniref:putative progesterone-induced-blocking factor n=1 Tax=Schistosoma mansoni TaxID=6183 RepID=UPI00022DCB43|nr:putative progesterone-induced-blocking factor [Schistosoma mansoni]|eukprot:XP_018655031.1 putative progesterone-induced-blocking factor [Schistosoma mansoni]
MISTENKDSSDTNADNSSHFQAQILDSILNGDISDTGEDLTTETISKGKLKHEMRMLQTRFLNDSTALQNTKSLSKAREDELLVSFCTERATTESSELKADLAETIACKRRLLNENEELHSQLNSIREILLTKLPNKLENIDMDQINISNYSLLTSKEFNVLNNKAMNNLSTLELVKNFNHNNINNENSNIETHRKHVQFVDTTLLLSPNSSLSTVQLMKCNQPVKQSNQSQSNITNNYNLDKNDDDHIEKINTKVNRNIIDGDKLNISDNEDSVELQSIDQEIYNKELTFLREQKENAISECTNLKSQLKETECLLNQYKEKIDEMKSSNKYLNNERDNQLREQIKTAIINLEVEQAARKDASLEVEKLNAQLDVSKKLYYELESRFNQEKTIWKIKEEDYEKRLHLFEINEKEMNELLLNIHCDSTKLTNISAFSHDLCSKSKMNSVYLLKTIQELKSEVSSLQSELVKKCQEIEELNKSMNWKSIANQPTNCLYQTISQKDNQIHALYNQLADIEKRSLLYKEERDKLASERNLLCEDLERLLTRRQYYIIYFFVFQSLTKLREFIISLLQQIQSNSNAHFNKLCQCQNNNFNFNDNNIDNSLLNKLILSNNNTNNNLINNNRISNIHQQVYDIIRSP